MDIVVEFDDGCHTSKPGYAPVRAESSKSMPTPPLTCRVPPLKYRSTFVPETVPLPFNCKPAQNTKVPPVWNVTLPPLIVRWFGYTPLGYTPLTSGVGLAPAGHAPVGTTDGMGSAAKG